MKLGDDKGLTFRSAEAVGPTVRELPMKFKSWQLEMQEKVTPKSKPVRRWQGYGEKGGRNQEL